MNRLQKYFLSSVSALLFAFTASCGTVSTPVNPGSVSYNDINNTFFVDLSQKTGKKTGVSFSLTIKGDKSFNTKASSDGALRTIAQIKSYYVALCTNPGAPISSKLYGTHFQIDRNMVAPIPNVITFTNVPTGGPYYALVGAYSDISTGSGINLTKTTNYSVDGPLQFALSSNSVTVMPDLKLSPPGTVLTVNLQLEDSVGASIDTEITPADGTIGLFGAL